jgi:hypothetical protein
VHRAGRFGRPAAPRQAEAAIAANQALRNQAVWPNPDEQAPSSQAQSPAIVRVVALDGGFDWGDAGIGAGGVLVLVGLGLAATRAATSGRRRNPREQRAIATR